MAQETLDERLRKSCRERISEAEKIDINEEFERVANEIGLSSADCGGTISFHACAPTGCTER